MAIWSVTNQLLRGPKNNKVVRGFADIRIATLRLIRRFASHESFLAINCDVLHDFVALIERPNKSSFVVTWTHDDDQFVCQTSSWLENSSANSDISMSSKQNPRIIGRVNESIRADENFVAFPITICFYRELNFSTRRWFSGITQSIIWQRARRLARRAGEARRELFSGIDWLSIIFTSTLPSIPARPWAELDRLIDTKCHQMFMFPCSAVAGNFTKTFFSLFVTNLAQHRLNELVTGGFDSTKTLRFQFFLFQLRCRRHRRLLGAFSADTWWTRSAARRRCSWPKFRWLSAGSWFTLPATLLMTSQHSFRSSTLVAF